MKIGLIFVLIATSSAKIIKINSGSYTDELPVGLRGPEYDELSMTSNIEAPLPTNKWWSSVLYKVREASSEHIYALPLAIKCNASGIGISYPNVTVAKTGKTIEGVYNEDISLRLADKSFSAPKLDNYSDWTVTILWDNNAGSRIRATVGHGLPYVYAELKGGKPIIKFNGTPNLWYSKSGVLGVTINGRHYGIYGLPESSWSPAYENNYSGDTNFISIAVIADRDEETLMFFKKYAHNFVVDTSVTWKFDEQSSELKSTYQITTEYKSNGAKPEPKTIMALFPHQWKNTKYAIFLKYEYTTIRGKFKTIESSEFSTVITYRGILPHIPNVRNYDRQKLNQFLEDVRKEEKHFIYDKTDIYFVGKAVQRIAVLLPIAKQIGNHAAYQELRNWLKGQLEMHFAATDSTGKLKSNNLFYYEKKLGVLIGYPANDDIKTDSSVNSHHNIYGLWIRSAVEIAIHDKQWATEWGGMVNMLIASIANTKRTKEVQFPFLRCFDVYEGHSWESGFGTTQFGNHQQASGEAINTWASIILWGGITNDKATRDLGIYLYTTEISAVQQYVFNIDRDNFPSGYGYNYAAYIHGGISEYRVSFTEQPEIIRGINLLPLSGSSVYHGFHPTVVRENLAQLAEEMKPKTPNTWKDILWIYQSFQDSDEALNLFLKDENYIPEGGESKAHTFSMICSLKSLGLVNTSVTANTAFYSVFDNDNATTSYVVFNPSETNLIVKFSNGVSVNVPPKQIIISPNDVFENQGEVTYVAFNPTNNDTSVKFSDGVVLKVPAKKFATSPYEEKSCQIFIKDSMWQCYKIH